MKLLAQSALILGLSGALDSAQATERTNLENSEFNSWLKGVVQTLSEPSQGTTVTITGLGAEGEGVIDDRRPSFPSIDVTPVANANTTEKDQAAGEIVATVMETVRNMGDQIKELPRSRTARLPVAVRGMSLPLNLRDSIDGGAVNKATFSLRKFEANDREGPECFAGNFSWPSGVTVRGPSRTDFAKCKDFNDSTIVISVEFPKGTGTQFFGLGDVSKYVNQVGMDTQHAATHIVLASHVSREGLFDCTQIVKKISSPRGDVNDSDYGAYTARPHEVLQAVQNAHPSSTVTKYYGDGNGNYVCEDENTHDVQSTVAWMKTVGFDGQPNLVVYANTGAEEATYLIGHNSSALPSLEELGTVFKIGPKWNVKYNSEEAAPTPYSATEAAAGGVQ